MMQPAVPKPTAKYMAAKRAESKKASPECDDDNVKEILREQAPFWMNQATLAYSVPDNSSDINLSTGIPYLDACVEPNKGASGTQEYNTVNFDAAIQQVNDMLVGTNVSKQNPDKTSVGKYLAMGSFFKNDANDPGAQGLLDKNLQGRYFLAKVGDVDWTIPNLDVPSPLPDVTLVAPAGSFILGFSGTEITAKDFDEFLQDGFFGFEDPADFPIETSAGTICYESYKQMMKVSVWLSHGRPAQPVLSRAPRHRLTPRCLRAPRSRSRTPWLA